MSVLNFLSVECLIIHQPQSPEKNVKIATYFGELSSVTSIPGLYVKDAS